MFSCLRLASQKRLLVYFQAGIAALFVAAIFGIGARPAHACGFGSSIAGGQCRGFLTVGTTIFTVPADWNSASNTIELIGGGSNGGISGGNGGVGGGGGAYSKITNQSLSGTVGLAVSQANHSSQVPSGSLHGTVAVYAEDGITPLASGSVDLAAG